VRVDLNVPVENGKPADLTRIERVAPTIREIADKGGKVILLAFRKAERVRSDCRSSSPRRSPTCRAACRFRRRLHRRERQPRSPRCSPAISSA
jgi:hypothetical protein